MKPNRPQLRFPEFYEPWEVKRLDEICIINPKTAKLPNKFFYIDLDVVNKGVLKEKKIINLRDAPSRAQRLLKSHDVLYQMVRPYQKNNLLFKENGDFVASTGYAQLRAIEDASFLYHILNTQVFVNKVISRCTGTSYPAINSYDLSTIKIHKPKQKEQQKIANFLRSVDAKVEKLEAKKDALERHKKGMMQKIFNQEIRFTQDDGTPFSDWEEKKLREVCKKKSSNLSISSLKENKGIYKVYGAMGVIQYIDFYLEDKPYISIIKDGAGVGRVFLCDAESSTVGTLDIIKNTSNSCLKFVYYLISLINFKKFIIGSTISHIYFKDYGNESILVPSLSEQQKIANFLSAIDQRIETVEQKIEHTRLFKKSLMQKMFV